MGGGIRASPVRGVDGHRGGHKPHSGPDVDRHQRPSAAAAYRENSPWVVRRLQPYQFWGTAGQYAMHMYSTDSSRSVCGISMIATYVTFFRRMLHARVQYGKYDNVLAKGVTKS